MYSRPMRTIRLDSASNTGFSCITPQVTSPLTTRKTARTVHLPRARIASSSCAAPPSRGRSSIPVPLVVIRVQAVGEAHVEGQVLAQVLVDPLVHVADGRGGYVHDVEGAEREVAARVLASQHLGEIGRRQLVAAVARAPHDQHVGRAGAGQEAAGLE